MKATIVDLRYRMKEILRALKRREPVHILYHGKEAGVIMPLGQKKNCKVAEHPFFGCAKTEEASETVEKKLNRLREKRHRDL